MILIDVLREHNKAAPLFDTPAVDEVFPLLVRRAADALTSGVRMTLSEYRALSWIERRAFAKAGEEVAAKQAQSIGAASSSLMGAALVTAEHDDGSVAEELALVSMHARAVGLAGGSRG